MGVCPDPCRVHMSGTRRNGTNEKGGSDAARCTEKESGGERSDGDAAADASDEAIHNKEH